jgi:thiol:disulfide interchange protein
LTQAFVLTHDRQADGQMRLYFQIKPGYYLYQKRLKFDGLPAEQHPQLPPALNHHDEFFGDSAVYATSWNCCCRPTPRGSCAWAGRAAPTPACATRRKPR